MMSSEVETLKVVFEDDNTGQDILVYSGQTILASFPQPFSTWLLSGTPMKFCSTTACTVTLPNFLEVKEILQTITAMTVYSGKSIEELRLEDYNLKRPQYSSKASYSTVNWYDLNHEFEFRKQAESLFTFSEKKGKPPIHIPSYSLREQFGRCRSVNRWVPAGTLVSTDSSTDESGEPLPSVSYSFTPNINFISESDPVHVFTAPQPPAAVNEPLSSLSVSEGQQLRDALLKSIVKCMQIQNSLYRLVLLKLQACVTALTDADSQRGAASNVSKFPITKSTGESQNDAPVALLCELKEPLNALMRCADIQRSLFQRLITVNLITTEEADQSVTVTGNSLSIDNQDVQTKPQANLMEIQSEVEEITFNNKMECSYARNPFTALHLKASTSKDAIHHISVKGRHFPHRHGNLKTLKGKLLYSGEWRKGKRHGKGEGLIVSLHSHFSTLDRSTEHGFYTGGWKHNMRHGHGQMMFSSGAVYEGQWQFDKMTGYGTLKLPDGTIQEGTWKEGSLQGCALFTWPHGVTEYREYDANRGQLSSCKIEKEAATKLSQMSSIRSQLLTLRECVAELKEERNSLTEQLNTKKIEYAEARNEIMSTLGRLKANFIAQRKKDVQKQQDEYEKKLKEATESESKSAKRIRELEKQLDNSLNAQLCQICFEHPRDCIIMPCTHLLYCRACVAEYKRSGGNRCPTCRGPISGEVLCNISHSS